MESAGALSYEVGLMIKHIKRNRNKVKWNLCSMFKCKVSDLSSMFFQCCFCLINPEKIITYFEDRACDFPKAVVSITKTHGRSQIESHIFPGRHFAGLFIFLGHRPSSQWQMACLVMCKNNLFYIRHVTTSDRQFWNWIKHMHVKLKKQETLTGADIH